MISNLSLDYLLNTISLKYFSQHLEMSIVFHLALGFKFVSIGFLIHISWVEKHLVVPIFFTYNTSLGIKSYNLALLQGQDEDAQYDEQAAGSKHDQLAPGV